MSLSLVQTKFTAPKEAVELYADYLSSLTLCVDYSVHPPSLFFAKRRKPASVETITAKFPKWAEKNNVKIEDYPAFIEKLTAKVKARLPHVYGMAFKPVDEGFFDLDEGITVANTFVPFLPPQAPPAPAEVMEYFERLFPNDADRKYILQFFGHAFQHPLIRPSHSPLITGDQGNGKSTIHAVLRKGMGGKHVYDDNSYSSAFTEFSSVLPDNMFVVFDDAIANKHTHGRLKVEITRTQQTVNVKHQTYTEERNVYARVIVLSNFETPMEMDNCRRFYATEFATHVNKHNPEGTKANTDAFFARFFAWMETPQAAAQLRQFFLSVDLEGFNPFSIPQTPTLLAMIENGRSALGKLIETYVEDLPCFHMNQLYSHLKTNNIPNPNLDAITAVLAGLGYTPKRRIVEGCGEKQVDVWTPPARAGKKQTRGVTEAEAAEIAHALGFYSLKMQ